MNQLPKESHPTTRDTVSRKHSKRIWLVYWAVLTGVTLMPVPPNIPEVVSKSDKLIHFLLYALLTLLGARATPRARRTPTFLLKWGAIYILFGAANEWLQQFANRTPSTMDFLADVCGVAAASLWLLLRRNTRQISEPGGLL